ncbi:MAG: AIR synthase-related protein, partial [Thermoplasmata archaeon]
IPSGNVSFYNESHHGTVLPTPVALGCGIVENIALCITADLKREGSSIYLIGSTQDAMAGSEFFRQMNCTSSRVPVVDLPTLKNSIEYLLEMISQKKILSCHDVSDGGIAVCLCEMAIGGMIGAEIDLSPIKGISRSDSKLFSESPTRWLVEVPAEEELPLRNGIEIEKIGRVGGESVLISDAEKILFDASLSDIECKWASTIWELMG